MLRCRTSRELAALVKAARHIEHCASASALAQSTNAVATTIKTKTRQLDRIMVKVLFSLKITPKVFANLSPTFSYAFGVFNPLSKLTHYLWFLQRHRRYRRRFLELVPQPGGTETVGEESKQ